jgi:hypothetical protein
MYWEKFPEAIATGQQVVTNSNYALAANYQDNFTRANETSTELLIVYTGYTKCNPKRFYRVLHPEAMGRIWL